MLFILAQACQTVRDANVYGRPGHSDIDFKNAVKVGRYVMVEYTEDGIGKKSGFKVGCKDLDGFGMTCNKKIDYKSIMKLTQQRSESEKTLQIIGIGVWESFWAWVL